jgi:prolyl 4-hydroxylase
MIEFLGNRAGKLFAKACEETQYADNAMFTYWDTHYGPLPQFDESRFSRCIKLLPRKVTNPIDDKAALGQLLQHNPELFPCTYRRIDDIPADKVEPDSLWFVKGRGSAGGKNVAFLRYTQLAETPLQKDQIVQEGVSDLQLLDGKKYTVRAYLLIWNQQLYLYRSWYRVIHSAPYSNADTDYDIQVSMRHGPGGAAFEPANPVAHKAEYRALKRINRRLKKLLSSVAEQSSRDVYSILGCDYLLEHSGNAKLIEINTSPNLEHEDRVISRKIIYPMMRDAVSMVVTETKNKKWRLL